MNEIKDMMNDTLTDTHNKEIAVDRRGMDIEGLIDKIKFASNLSDDKRKLFLRLGDMYMRDMEGNLFKSQFELAVKYAGTTADEWTAFLMDNITRKYIDKNKDMFIKLTAEKNLTSVLGKGKKDSINVIDKIEAKQQTESKQNIIIMRIPAIEDRK